MKETHHNQDFRRGGAIRITLLSSCQSGCDFCHLEGFKATDEIGTLNPALINWKTTGKFDNIVSLNDVAKTIEIARQLGITDVNLTGGEPTLHPDLIRIVKMLYEAGLSVAITTHAEMPTGQFQELLHSGLEYMIISLHAISEQDYVNMDLVAQSIGRRHSNQQALDFATRRLTLKRANLTAALAAREAGNLKDIITNTVIKSVSQASGIISYLNDLDIIPRIQRDLNQRSETGLLIEELIKSLDAQLHYEHMAVGDSSGAGSLFKYLNPQKMKEDFFILKEFGNVYVEAMCHDCSKRDTEQCREKFYGVRVEPGHVCTCIDIRELGKTLFTIQDFLYGLDQPQTVPFAINEQYKQYKNSN